MRRRTRNAQDRRRGYRRFACHERLEMRLTLDSTLVINEVMYNSGGDGDQSGEWIEFYNQLSVDMDVSEWYVDGGVRYTFPVGTVIPGNSYLIVAVDPSFFDDVTDVADVSIFGPWEGRLNNRGEEIRLYDHNDRLISSVDYRDRGAWPDAADGSGVSLAKYHSGLASHIADSWTHSQVVGGTPGRENFAVPGTFHFVKIVPEETAVKAVVPKNGRWGLDWTKPEFDDADWLTGVTGVGHDSGRGTGFKSLFGLNLEDPPDGQSPMPVRNVNGSFYVRIPFGIPETKFDTLRLGIRYDDGFVAYINGVEVARSKAPSSLRWNSLATASNSDRDAVNFEYFSLQDHVHLLNRDQENVLAIHSMNLRLSNNDGMAYPILEGGTLVEPLLPPTLLINELASATAESFFVELVNASDEPMDLADFSMKHLAEVANLVSFPSETLGVGGMKVLSPEDLGGRPDENDLLLLYSSDGQQLLDARRVTDRPGARHDAHAGDWLHPSKLTAGVVNEFSISDAIVINEIMFHHRGRPSSDGMDRVESQEEWIELTNRTTSPVDISGWQLTEAVEFTFANKTIVDPGEFVVVAKDVEAVRIVFPDVRYLGEYTGSLADSNERILLLDQRGNPVDEVHYFDSKPWPEYADGKHSSLELIDVDADNSKAASWAASVESHRSDWQQISYRGVAGPGDSDSRDYHELVMGMLDEGEILIDDIRVIENPDADARQLIQNSTFDAGNEKWRIIGNHAGTVVADPEDPSNQVLHLVSTGRTDDIHNHVETTLKFGDTFATVTEGQSYEISFRAKWLGGSNQLHTRLYFNELPKSHVIEAPVQNGTPGQPNSTAVENAGPSYSSLSQSPVIPDAEQEVVISIDAYDRDGIGAMQLYYTTGEAWEITSMSTDDGITYTGVIPGQPEETMVQFYVAAVDQQGANSMYPPAGPDSRAMIQFQDGNAKLNTVHNFRIIMAASDSAVLHERTSLMSNRRHRATVVYDEEVVYYDVGVRLSGASSSRQSTQHGYNVQFHADQLLLGIHETVTVDRNNPNEIFVRHLINNAGGVPGMYNDVIHVIGTRRDRIGTAQLRLARYDDVYLASQFQDGQEGLLFEKELTYRQALSQSNDPESLKVPFGYSHPLELNTDLEDFGDDKEAYRWHWLVKNHRERDDYRQIVALNKAFSLTGPELQSALVDVIDVDQWLRTFAVMRLFGNRDFYSQPSGYQGHWRHNFQAYVRPEDNRVLVLPWDIDESFQISTSSTIFGVGNVTKLIQLPDNLHYYYGHLDDLMTASFNTEYMDAWKDHYGELLKIDLSRNVNYITSRVEYVRSQLPAELAFELKTQDQTINDSQATLSGAGWVNVREIRLADSLQPIDVIWTSPTTWEAVIPVGPGVNELSVEAFDFRGNRIDTPFANAVTITSTWEDRPQLNQLRVTEINYHPADPSSAEAAAGYDRDDDFEYIELVNKGDQPIELAGARFTEGITFDFSESSVSVLQPNEHVLVVEDIGAFRYRFGSSLLVAGQWSGGLSGNGELLVLIDLNGNEIHRFQYLDDVPWPVAADGGGATLEVVDTEANYNSPENWRASVQGGTPGAGGDSVLGDFDHNGQLNVADIDLLFIELRADEPDLAYDLNGDGRIDELDRDVMVRDILQTNYGDVNLDGVFDSEDLVRLLQIGSFEEGDDRDSTWGDGDWNGDGDFTSEDFVLAFQSGGYTA